MISPATAVQAGGFYAEEPLRPFPPRPDPRADAGDRSCVRTPRPSRRRRREPAVARYRPLRLRTGRTYVAGSPSIPLTDGGSTAAGVWDQLSRSRRLAPPELRVVPHTPWRPDGVARPARHTIPAVVRGYLLAGAMVCGPPAYDTALRSADLFMLLDTSSMPPGYARRYLGKAI